MRTDRHADVWDDVWAEHDARQAARHSDASAVPAPKSLARIEAQGWLSLGNATGSAYASRAAECRVRAMSQMGIAALSSVALVTAWLVLPWLLALRLSMLIEMGDAPAIVRQFDTPAASASWRAGLAKEIPDEVAAAERRFLSGLADGMAASWEKPEGMVSWLALRARSGAIEDSPLSLRERRMARPTGLASFRLEYGPTRGDDGVAFDLAWQTDGFRITGLHFLGGRARRAPASSSAPAV